MRNGVKHNDLAYINTRIKNLTERIQQNLKLLELNPVSWPLTSDRASLQRRVRLDQKVLKGWQAKLAAVQPEPKDGDAALLDQWSKITDPKEALRTLVAHEDFLGYDPYYRDLRAALLAMCERCGGGPDAEGT